jgi:hypothetical protein
MCNYHCAQIVVLKINNNNNNNFIIVNNITCTIHLTKGQLCYML